MHSKLRALPELFILTSLSLVTRFWNLFYPNAVVFDEVYFKHFAAQYFTGAYYFDIHPPLGKLLLAGWGRLIGYSGTQVEMTTAIGLRILPALAGAAIIPVFYLILRRLRLPRSIATLASVFLLFDGALLVESRFILLDSMLILFGLSGLYFYLVSRDSDQTKSWLAVIASGLLLGAALSTKWTGLGMVGLVGLLLIWNIIREKGKRLDNFLKAAVVGILIFAVYAASFWAHFALLTKTGEGDAFMSPQFQATLIGNTAYDGTKLNFGQQFVELNYQMYTANTRLTASHPYGSPWYTWPVTYRGVYYWNDQVSPQVGGHIYILGNPIVWWLTLLGSFLTLGLILARKFDRRYYPALGVLALGYLVNLVPFANVTRVLFLYHYLFCLILSIGIAAIAYHHIIQMALTSKKYYGYAAICAVVILSFMFFAPIWYGWPLTTDQLQMRMWLPTWR